MTTRERIISLRIINNSKTQPELLKRIVRKVQIIKKEEK